jgi:hypothetical protein
MVSTGENSSSSEFAAAFAALTQSGMSLEALAGVRGVASWANPKPDMAYGNGTASTAMDELAEAALAYSHYEPNAATTRASASLTLVADNAAAGEESDDRLESEELKAAKEVVIALIDDMIEQARMNGDEVGKARLEDILKSVKSAEKFRQLASAQSQIGQASGGKVETIEQKRERLLLERVKAEEKAQAELKDAMKKAHDEGKITDEEEYKKYMALQDEIEEYKRKHPEWYRNKEQTAVVDAMQAQAHDAARKSTNDPEVYARIDAAETQADERRAQQQSNDEAKKAELAAADRNNQQAQTVANKTSTEQEKTKGDEAQTAVITDHDELLALTGGAQASGSAPTVTTVALTDTNATHPENAPIFTAAVPASPSGRVLSG